MALVTSVEKLTLTLTGGTTSVAADIAATTTAKCVPFITSRVSVDFAAGSRDQNEDLQVDVEFISGTPDQVQVSTTEADANREVIVEVTVVEFSSEATVQTGTFSLTAATDLSTTASPTVESPVTKSFALAYYKTTVGNNNTTNLVRAEITATNTLTFTRDDNTAGIDGHWWTVTAAASEFSVQQVTWQMGIGATVEATKSATITTVGDVAQTMIVASIEGDGNALADDNDRIPIVYLEDASTLTMRRQLSSNVGIEATAFVIEFTGTESVQRPSGGYTTQAVTPPTSQSVAITSVDHASDGVAMAWGVRAGGCCSAAGTSTASAGHADVYVGLDFASDVLVRMQHSMFTTGEPGPIDIAWEVIEWDVGGAAPAARRVMVIS